jgi:sigma-B regulation protein RsbU (phosphoserine phosphatase)
MEDHAKTVGRERQIVALALKAQSGRLRQIIEGKEKRIGRSRNQGLVSSAKHFTTLKDGNSTPLKVDYDNVRITLTKDATITKEEATQIFKPMIRSFRKLERSNPDLIYWQIIRLDNGAIATYPYYETKNLNKSHGYWMASANLAPLPQPLSDIINDNSTGPPRMIHEGVPPHEWYRTARRTTKGLFWLSPFRDPITGRFIVAAINRIQEYKGKYHGAIMVMVPLGSVLKNDLNITGMAKNSTSMLVRKSVYPNGDSGLQIIAEEHQNKSTSPDKGGWMARPNSQWLKNDNAVALDSMVSDINSGYSGIQRMSYDAKDCLWIYAPIVLSETALILVIPMENIISSTLEAEHYVRTEIEKQFTTLTYCIWVLAVTVLFISLLISKTMTTRISGLASAFHRLAKGDFSARIMDSGKDELSNLTNTFNKLAPALKEQVRLKEALAIAQEVQRSLLPEKPPKVKGLDVAGMSLYCEDTGGDYFDYPHLGIEADELGLAVGDVSGHGVPAALLMTTARALLRQRAENGGSLGAVVGDANRMLSEDVRLSGRFMTLFMFAVDLESHTARWVRAGHDPALVYLPATDSFSELSGDTGLPLGVDGDWEYIEETTYLEPGTIVLIGTDGIWEATNSAGTMYGKERLSELLRSHHQCSAQDILEITIESLKDFTGEAGFEDDVTLALVKVDRF